MDLLCWGKSQKLTMSLHFQNQEGGKIALIRWGAYCDAVGPVDLPMQELIDIQLADN